ncbi:actin filament-associated protein 1 isoform X1 [Canis lupus familiaris]|uniref:actin filament-associated protein 1 isoform X1 n=1 Tax=Canis lupus familiaris TaxID=9615 RepID=UPI000BAA231E|nr:actin filament-associated protein 1 isoform X1 [Canis lupus familiaris]XP_025294397.1 actin filament-associated protein 1 isoform X3 [Canis lupus dingo]XP_038389025.1 actin filament-associated protein 1 isoform X1 [Canis lupus familiaris]XP_038517536.1 actin filament-associated protein 1 isoform X1 [Canis lupus familiaris]|eukprot:XP_022272768.1 actin filament-associated protein 1 isoform X3 [Canis lupus familiaris]
MQSGSRCEAMEELIVELRLFLELLDHEYLTSTVREKKAVITDILLRIQSSKGFEVKDHAQKQETPNSLPAPPQMPLPEIPQPWLPPDSGPPPLPTSSLPEGYYEEAVPLSPGKAPEYITSNYDSDAMSSSYESYDEEEEDGKGKKTRHQWPSEEASMDLVKDAKICAFLLRKKRFGQWSKLLCVVKDTKLLCYKSSKDQQPQMELPLQGCNVTYTPKDSKKKKHELKITQQGTDPLVLAVQSKEQAEQWLKVIRDVYSGCSGPADSEGPPPSSSPVHKTELEKKLSSERPSSDGEGVTENGITVCNGKEQVKRKKSSKSEAKGTVSKVTGKKITKIIGLGKKKPSTDEQTSSAEEDVPTCGLWKKPLPLDEGTPSLNHSGTGYLNVLSNNRWRERWCRVKDNKLIFHKDRTDLKTHIVSIPLRGCDVIPGLDSRHPLTFRLLRNGQEVAVLEASSSEDMGRWIGILLAETGSSTDPGALHYDYIDVETSANVIQTAKQTFCFMNRRGISANPYLGSTTNGYAHPSGMALHYDDVPCINGSWDPEDGPPASCARGLGEEVLYDNAVLYDNLPSPKIFARYPPADRKASRPSPDKLSCNHYKCPPSCGLPLIQSATNPSSLGRASLGLSSQVKGKKPPVASSGVTGKGKTLSSQQKKVDSTAGVKRTSSNADQYKYGKNRVEADAKRLQSKEDELLKRKETLRNRLAQLRKERRDLRAAIEVNAGRKTQVVLEDKLKRLEEECKQKEAERVNLELELTEVTESLKKALAGGVTLGLAIEPRSGTSSPQSPVFRHRTLESSPMSSCETSDAEGPVPVNSAAVLRKGQPASGSPCRGHVLRKAKEWELKNGT